jgi:glycosyltransferase involved in cell wall biosynthesis
MPDSLEIAMAIGSFLPNIGGAQVFFHNLAVRLQRRGHDVLALTAFEDWLKAGAYLESDTPYPIRPLPPRNDRWPQRAPRLYLGLHDRYLRAVDSRFDADVWLSFGAFPTGVTIGHYTAGTDEPHVVRVMGYGVNKDEERDYGYRRDDRVDHLVRQWLPTASKVVTLTENGKRACLELGVASERLRSIPCALDPSRFDETTDRDEIRETHGIPTDDWVFLVPGRKDPVKGLTDVLDAAERLTDRQRSGLHIVFVGSGTEELETEARSRGLDGSVTALGTVGLQESEPLHLPPRRLIEIYNACDACIFPSHMETFGNVTLEAMAASLPIITTDITGPGEIVTHEEDGLLVPPGDPKALADEMEALLDNPSKASKLGTAARKTVERKYTWGTVVDRYEDLFEQVTESSTAEGVRR